MAGEAGMSTIPDEWYKQESTRSCQNSNKGIAKELLPILRNPHEFSRFLVGYDYTVRLGIAEIRLYIISRGKQVTQIINAKFVTYTRHWILHRFCCTKSNNTTQKTDT